MKAFFTNSFSDRKCMSVIIENSKGEIWLLIKGAESSLIPKCDNGPGQETMKHIVEFALVCYIMSYVNRVFCYRS
jgi:magnesium-transporting ATPase (P-type)